MVKKILSSVLMALFCVFAWGQQNVNIEGVVSDSKSGSISRASVQILNTNYGTFTDDHGKFRFENLKPGKYVVNVSATGYTSINEEITAGDSKPVNVVLDASDVSLEEVVVTAQKRDELVQKLPLSISVLSSEKVKE
ncbi:MAG: carboxypeptidase-like regulatory domain-containing protein, partial [Bacteroidota bacterium]